MLHETGPWCRLRQTHRSGPLTCDDRSEHHDDHYGVVVCEQVPAAVADERGPVEGVDEDGRQQHADGAAIAGEGASVPRRVQQVGFPLDVRSIVQLLAYKRDGQALSGLRRSYCSYGLIRAPIQCRSLAEGGDMRTHPPTFSKVPLFSKNTALIHIK